MSKTIKVVCPEVRILDRAWQRLLAYIDACPREISGLGAVETDGNALTVTEVILLRQKSSSVDTELDSSAIMELLNDWTSKGRDIEKLKFWWHSHANMPCFWSSTDRDTIRLLTGDGGYLVSYVGNRRGEYCLRLSLMAGRQVYLAADDLEMRIMADRNVRLAAEVRQEIREKVKVPLFPWNLSAKPTSQPEDAKTAELIDDPSFLMKGTLK